MIGRILIAVLIFAGLEGCTSVPKVGVIENDQKLVEAMQFRSYPEEVNLYLAYPQTTADLVDFFYVNYYVNDKKITQLVREQFTHVRTTPGKHHFKAVLTSPAGSTMGFSNTTIAEFELDFEAGSTPMLACSTSFGLVGPTMKAYIRMILSDSDCQEGGKFKLSNESGVVACTRPFIEAKGEHGWSGVTYTYENPRKCLLNTSQEVFAVGLSELVRADVQFIDNNGSDEFATAKKAHDLNAYRAFKSKYSSSRHLPELNKLVDTLEASMYQKAQRENSIGAYNSYLAKFPGGRFVKGANKRVEELKLDAKINAILQGYSNLPTSVKKDKLMITLTNHLKRQNYSESILYFNVLERMHVSLSPSFEYFWGEALIKTGNNADGIAKLYSYINKVGAKGRHYTKALILSNEAESNRK